MTKLYWASEGMPHSQSPASNIDDVDGQMRSHSSLFHFAQASCFWFLYFGTITLGEPPTKTGDNNRYTAKGIFVQR